MQGRLAARAHLGRMITILATGAAFVTGAARAEDGPQAAPSGGNPIAGYFAAWFDRVREAQDSQPKWMTPIATVTPRLEQEFRYDQYWENLGNGAHVTTIDSGKGLELIPTTSTELLFNLPAYTERTVVKPTSGWSDWQFLVIKQRFLSANENSGNYVVSGFLGFQAPTGAAVFTNHSWMITPTIAAGKGFGRFNVQATLGVPLPLSHEAEIGHAITGNVALQYHLGTYFWPEFETNMIHWAGGPRDGKTQVFLTPGLILGRFKIAGRTKFIIGVGRQFAVSPKLTTTPVLTPTYDGSWILTVRTAF
jgi:hypothetical protein